MNSPQEEASSLLGHQVLWNLRELSPMAYEVTERFATRVTESELAKSIIRHGGVTELLATARTVRSLYSEVARGNERAKLIKPQIEFLTAVELFALPLAHLHKKWTRAMRVVGAAQIFLSVYDSPDRLGDERLATAIAQLREEVERYKRASETGVW